MWNNLRARLIRLLGGHVEPVVKTQEIRIPYLSERVEYRSGRPLDALDWDRLSKMDSWAEPLMRFLADQVKQVDAEEKALPYAPEHDRTRLALQVRRAALQDLQRLPAIAAAKVLELLNREDAARPREKGLSNNGK